MALKVNSREGLLPTASLRNWLDEIALQPDVQRGFRAAVALILPLLICSYVGSLADGFFIALAGQNLSLPDFRGGYRTRLAILSFMILIAASSAAIGVLVGKQVLAAVIAMGILGLLSGFWRHLSADYGPSISVSSGLFFLLALSRPGGWTEASHTGELIVLGGIEAMILHVGLWSFHPQHPLRYATAEPWVSVSDIIAVMRQECVQPDAPQRERISVLEGGLRQTLDHAFLILSRSDLAQRSSLLGHLEEMRRLVVEWGMSLTALRTSIEELAPRREFAKLMPIIDSVLKVLGDASRSVALTLILHRPENLAATKIRLRRCRDLIRVLNRQLETVEQTNKEIQVLHATFNQVLLMLPRVVATLTETVDSAPFAVPSPRLLPELGVRPIGKLASWTNPVSKFDPTLVRHAIRICVLTKIAVAIYKEFNIPRGYWIALSIIVVLQPDYGSTRQRAAERIGGTLLGSILGSLLLWIKLPIGLLYCLTAGATFGFAYFLKRRYRLAVLFVTIMIVVLTETTAPVQWDFTVTRLLATFSGGMLALVAARAFWPIWERETFTSLLAASIRGNKEYLRGISQELGLYREDSTDILMLKRRVENQNRYVSASLERLLSEPEKFNANSERDSSLAMYNQRITRALTTIVLHLQELTQSDKIFQPHLFQEMSAVLEALAQTIQSTNQSEGIPSLLSKLTSLELSLSAQFEAPSSQQKSSGSCSSLIWTQLIKVSTEIHAMIALLK